ncbi:MAG TPA: PEP-CTERM sorting domain-containing protein [Fimbriimonadaceae bacterium]|nr:PEP-CTERM sorting domain-containing protein [Fimbriimonadaceae bacterium]
MERGLGVLAAASIAAAASAQFSNPSFESGFSGWSTIGDAQIETSSIGTYPTDGSNQALLATATDGTINTDVVAGSGVGGSALESFLQVGSGTIASVGNGNPVLGSATVQTVVLSAGQTVKFDWDFLTNQVYNDGTADSYAPLASNDDFAFLTVAPVGNPSQSQIFKLADVFDGYVSDPNAPGGFDTAFHITPALDPFISETLYSTYSWTASTGGSYVIGVGSVHVTAGADDGINSAVLADNFRVVPEPASLCAFGLLSLGLLRRRRSR